jgi:hypothetical protein
MIANEVPSSGSQGHRMRKTITALVVLIVLWLGYVGWPLRDLLVLTRAFETRNVETLTSHINFAAVRASLTRQIVAAYLKRAGIKVNPLVQGAAAGAASSIADPIVARVISPEALAALMSNGWPVTVVPDKPASALGITSQSVGTGWQIFLGSEYGFGRFEVALPASLPPSQRFRLAFRLTQWRWRLVGITLPESIQMLLADELIKTQKPPPVTP